MNKLWIGILVVVVLIVVGAALVGSREEEMVATEPVDVSGVENGDGGNSTIIPTVPQDTAILSSVAPYIGNGMAVRSFDGVRFEHVVVAGLDAPAEGKFYEGWLVKKEPSLTFISTGELEFIDGDYVLSFTGDTDYLDYPDVVITEETRANGFDNQPEAHVLEGSF